MVLIVDDHRDTATLLARVLELHGHRATAVNSAKEALGMLERIRPDVIVLDVMMPEMDGPTLLRVIRKSVEFRKTPVVMYSADYSQDRYQEIRRLGAQDFIVKGSVDIDDLCDRIGRFDHPSTLH